MQFHARFRNEVIDAPATIGAHVARSREQLGEPFAVIFEALVSAHDRLAANPADVFAKVDFVTIYHVIIESTLGLTAFEFITRYLTRNELLPGFVDGYSHIHHDEQRHIGYGVWYVRQAADQRSRARAADSQQAARTAPRGRQRARSSRPRRYRLGSTRRQPR
jgi:ribonucleoside-diphosphate reductase beta chain